MKLPQQFKGIRLVVTDMDGTLLNPDHEVSERFFRLFEALSARGVTFVAASGRQYNSIVHKLQPIRERIYVIAENGGLAMQGTREIVSTPLDPGTKNSILDTLGKNQNIHPVLCARNNAFVSGHSEEFLGILKEYYTEFEVIENRGQSRRMDLPCDTHYRLLGAAYLRSLFFASNGDQPSSLTPSEEVVEVYFFAILKNPIQLYPFATDQRKASSWVEKGRGLAKDCQHPRHVGPIG